MSFPPSTNGWQSDDQTESQNGENESATEIKLRTIIDVYRDTWEEFYLWEQQYASELIRESTCERESAIHTGGGDVDYAFDDDQTLDMDAMDIDFDSSFASERTVAFTICDWDAAGELSKTRISAHSTAARQGARGTRSRNVVFKDHPRYEACTPTNLYIFENESAAMPACPFVKYDTGTSSFNARGFVRKFHSVQWQDNWCDPDWVIIAATTLYRLTAWASDGVESTALSIYCDDFEKANFLGLSI